MIPPRVAVLRGWGGATRARSVVYRPDSEEEVSEALADARGEGFTIAARGTGLSYGDAALNQGGAVLDLGGLSRIHDFDAERGLIRAGSGVTVADVWRTTLPKGWWPHVVPGTMLVSLGGAVAADIHGKNHLRAGAFGRYVEAARVVDSEGRCRTSTREPGSGPNAGPVLAEVIGGLGLTGVIAEVTLRLRKVHSGFLDVEGWATRSLRETLEAVDQGAREADYSVAWVDGVGSRSGRGVLHHARHVPPDHPLAGKGMHAGEQELPRRLGGVVPAEQAWRLLRLFMGRSGIRALNTGKWWAAAARGRHRYAQSHAAFHFLLDYLPGWQRAYGSQGFIQYQMFVPAAAAHSAFSAVLRAQQTLGLSSYLAVVKRHAAEPDSAARYALDGYSLAMDFPVGQGSRYTRLVELVRMFDDIRRDHEGRLYAAKDAMGRGLLPRRRDPAFSSNLVRRWARSP